MRKIFLIIALLALFCGVMSSAALSDNIMVQQEASFPYDPLKSNDNNFTQLGGWMQLSESLYRFDGCCNVYAVKRNGKALLIDYGCGEAYDRLGEIGVESVDRVLVTHHHRDQVQGLCDMDELPFAVTVPAAEAHYFEDVEGFWRDVKIYINYDCRSHWNTIRRSIRVDTRVNGGDTVSWEGIDFTAIDTPGHTNGAVSYAAEIDGRRVVFSGDLIAGKGKVVNWFDLHWDYYGFTQGTNASDESFERIGEFDPDVLLPSHGAPIDDPQGAMAENSRIYETLRPMMKPNEMYRPNQDLRTILPHLIYIQNNCYAILSDSGKAFLYDYGYVERGRLDEFKKQYNVKSIDIVNYSHYHDDHNFRTYELHRSETTDIWIFEKMLDVFENPFHYRLPCLPPFPIIADRVLREGEKVQWEEYTLEFYHMPGQTEFHQGLNVVIDGKKVMFTGDNTWKKADHELSRNGPVVPHNEYFLDGGFITCAQQMIDYMPDIVCPAHTEEYSPSRDDLVQFLGWANSLRDIMTGLIDQPDPNFGMDYRWCRFYPYRTVTDGNGEIKVELMIRNHLFVPAEITVKLKHSDASACSRPEVTVTVDAKKEAAIPFVLTMNGDARGQREMITADITVNGRHIGEYAEAMIDLK